MTSKKKNRNVRLDERLDNRIIWLEHTSTQFEPRVIYNVITSIFDDEYSTNNTELPVDSIVVNVGRKLEK